MVLSTTDAVMIGAVGIGALYIFKKDVSAIVRPVAQVTGAVGDVASTTAQSFEEVTSVTEVFPTAVDILQRTAEREFQEGSERSRLKQERDILKLEAERERERRRQEGKSKREDRAQREKTEKQDIESTQETIRKKLVQEAFTETVETPIRAAQDVKTTFVSIFRPTKERGKERRKDTVRFLKNIKTSIFGKKIFGRG